MEDIPQYLTISEAAKLLEVTTTTLRNWDREGKLPAHRDPQNDYRLYATHDISRLLRERNNLYMTDDEKSLPGDFSPKRQLPLFPDSVDARNSAIDIRHFRLLVRQMSRAFRDSQGGGLLERFEEISKLLYCKLYDERLRMQNPDISPVFVCCNGESPQTTYARIVHLYESACELLPETLGSTIDSLSKDTGAVVQIVKLLQDVTLSGIPADIKGVVYEELVRNTFEKSDNQQFFTPRPVVEFLIHLIDPGVNDVLCDPACGSGGFLIAASTHVTHKLVATGQIQDIPQYLSNDISGFEIDRRMAWIAQMNLIMHGDGHGNVHFLPEGGALARTRRVDELIPPNSVDIIVTNPPFGSDYSDPKHLSRYILGRGKASRRRGILFLERCIDWIKPGGQLGIIIDDSVLNGKANIDVRELISERCVIEAVISLPDVTFMPYATAKTSVLLLRKKKRHDDTQPMIFMAEVENVGRRPNGDTLYDSERDESGAFILKNDLPRIIKAWRAFRQFGEDALDAYEDSIFACPPARISGIVDRNREKRLDVQFHHPARTVAERAIERSIYPTPKLAELVSVRNSTAVPASQDPDEIWNYIGLANITPETGEYTVSQVSGSQLKSTVRSFHPGDILFSKLRPELRKVALISEQEDEGWASSECLVLTPLCHSRENDYSGPLCQDSKRAKIKSHHSFLLGKLVCG